MNKYDLHVHTLYSPCSMNAPEKILEKAKKIGLNGIAITDHHTIKGALKTKSLNKDKDFEVIVGEEIETEYGDVLALYLKKEITTRKFSEVLTEARSQDALLIIPHPFRVPFARFKFPLESLKSIHALETINSRNNLFSNNAAFHKAKEFNLAQTGSSDAHLIMDIGNAYTIFDGDLRHALKNRSTIPQGTTLLSLPSLIISSINKRVLTPLGVKR